LELLRKRPAKTRANAESGTPSGYSPGIGGGSGAEATAAVVETLNVAVDVPLPGVTLAGVNAQLVCAGSPEQEKEIAELNAPLTPATATENCAVCPRVTVAVLPGAVSEKSGATTKLKDKLWAGLPDVASLETTLTGYVPGVAPPGMATVIVELAAPPDRFAAVGEAPQDAPESDVLQLTFTMPA